MLARAQTLSLEKRGAEAHEIYSELLARDPGDRAAQTGRAGNLMQMGRHSEAVAAFETALPTPRLIPPCSAAQPKPR